MTTKLRPEAKVLMTRWVERLERNQDPQTTGALHRNIARADAPAGMCCLGVLADELKEEAGLTTVEMSYGRIGYMSTAPGLHFPEDALLPREIMELLDISGIFVRYQGHLTSVVRLNDNLHLTFPEIAALVREEYGL